ncbi:MAG: hypothetical protein ACJ0DD_03980 [Paracoccaceae bacterium]
MKNFFNISICICISLISACNTTTQGAYNNYDYIQGGPVPVKIETEESKSTSNGKCLAGTLSWLIGQPETALIAMEYPKDTRRLEEYDDQSIDENYSSRLNLVIGSDRKITNVFCG